MRPLVLCLVVVFAGFGLGCDSGPKPEERDHRIPTIEEVRLSVSTGIDSRQSISAYRGPSGTFDARGRLLLPPGPRDISLSVYADTGSITDYISAGPDQAVLRFELSDTLEDRILVNGGDPTLTPLNPVEFSRSDRKRSPEPAPGLHLCVKDTSAAHGSLRLVLERYEEFTPREEKEPTRIDFDATVPLRTVQDLEREIDPYCWENGG